MWELRLFTQWSGSLFTLANINEIILTIKTSPTINKCMLYVRLYARKNVLIYTHAWAVILCTIQRETFTGAKFCGVTIQALNLFMVLNFMPALKQDHTHHQWLTHTRHYVEILKGELSTKTVKFPAVRYILYWCFWRGPGSISLHAWDRSKSYCMYKIITNTMAQTETHGLIYNEKCFKLWSYIRVSIVILQTKSQSQRSITLKFSSCISIVHITWF